MGDVLLALSIPVLVFASGIYAACDCWWRRRHPAPPSPYTHRAARLAEQDMLLLAGEIVDDAYAALGPLYDRPAARAPAADRPTALSPRPDATPDRVPSRPAPARKP
ncbi:hypothetical protein ACFCXC_09320 [Streptomyces microflavus]|uniref:Uncharacterized protein n=1 Tax=Streptomyces microflavus TaxID=1919 RepID=A0A6N9V1M6_STRMI|nr:MULTISPECIES: hypothetical protein [Streptomyces]MBW3359131.1 hypothetical protein [Streptomyces sp. 09ZI22]NEB66740.1 hypothetical protein [Streptomyces microflavus]QKW43649.1 hypothetical protein HUT09_14460 [Streptomyces microflavus]QQZ54758.1 hypothetical protein IFE09_14915 [Streptomyces microflavus]QTA32752.1 hypothetical protein JHY03_29130 [Streptomyces sp. CA-256286]